MKRISFMLACALVFILGLASCVSTGGASAALTEVRTVALASLSLVGDQDLLATPGVGDAVLSEALPRIVKSLEEMGYAVVRPAGIKEYQSMDLASGGQAPETKSAGFFFGLTIEIDDGTGEQKDQDPIVARRRAGELLNAPDSAGIIQHALTERRRREEFARYFAPQIATIGADAALFVTLETIMTPTGGRTTYVSGERAMGTLKLNSGLTLIDANGSILLHTGQIRMDDLAPLVINAPGYVWRDNKSMRDVAGARDSIRDILIRLLPRALDNSLKNLKK